MTGWLLAILLLSMPFKPEYWPALLEPEVEWSNARCRNNALACYYDETIYLKNWPWFFLWPHSLGAEHALIHEMGHHLQGREQIWRNPGGWDAFEAIVRELISTGDLDDDQKRNLESMLEWEPYELHAELPLILEGEIPPVLQAWYPWFEIKEAKDKG